VFEPVAAAAPGDVEADDPAIERQGAGEFIEVARIARQTMRANDDMRVVSLAPFDIGKPMEAMRAKAWKFAETRTKRHRSPSRRGATR
jgi:hypothetical protein